FQLVENQRMDVHLELFLLQPPNSMSQAVLATAHIESECRPVYLMSLNPAYPLAQLQAEFEIKSEANLFRLFPRHASSSVCPAENKQQASLSWKRMIEEAVKWR